MAENTILNFTKKSIKTFITAQVFISDEAEQIKMIGYKLCCNIFLRVVLDEVNLNPQAI